eukprot:s2037_g2.t1
MLVDVESKPTVGEAPKRYQRGSDAGGVFCQRYSLESFSLPHDQLVKHGEWQAFVGDFWAACNFPTWDGFISLGQTELKHLPVSYTVW